MLLSILFLPPVLGVSAYLVGMLFSFLLTALCNLLYLHKICPIFTKGGGQGCVHKLLLPLLWTLPLSFLGKILHTLFSYFLHAWIALSLTAVLLLVCPLLLYHFWGILPKWKEKQLLFKK